MTVIIVPVGSNSDSNSSEIIKVTLVIVPVETVVIVTVVMVTVVNDNSDCYSSDSDKFSKNNLTH